MLIRRATHLPLNIVKKTNTLSIMKKTNHTVIAYSRDQKRYIRMEVASSRLDHLPTQSAAKTSKLSLLVKHHILAIDEAS